MDEDFFEPNISPTCEDVPDAFKDPEGRWYGWPYCCDLIVVILGVFVSLYVTRGGGFGSKLMAGVLTNIVCNGSFTRYELSIGELELTIDGSNSPRVTKHKVGDRDA